MRGSMTEPPRRPRGSRATAGRRRRRAPSAGRRGPPSRARASASAYAGSAYWLSITTPMSGCVSRSALAARMPSSVPVGGIRMSVSTTSGTLGVDHGEQLVEVAARADHLDLGLRLEEPDDSFAHEIAVFGDDHPDRHGRQVTPRAVQENASRRFDGQLDDASSRATITSTPGPAAARPIASTSSSVRAGPWWNSASVRASQASRVGVRRRSSRGRTRRRRPARARGTAQSCTSRSTPASNRRAISTFVSGAG